MLMSDDIDIKHCIHKVAWRAARRLLVQTRLDFTAFTAIVILEVLCGRLNM